MDEMETGAGIVPAGAEQADIATPVLDSAAAVAAHGAVLPVHLSPWSMFMAADIIVQSVMIGLAIASVTTWTIWLAKSIEIARARRRMRIALHLVSTAHTLSDAAAKFGLHPTPDALLVKASLAEMQVSADMSPEGVKERVAIRLERLEAGASRHIALGTGILATIGATAPFVGLFGTVWGIMNSFIRISQAQTTNLAVVAPGIAEALLATGLGLAAAIPAVVIYNLFSRAIAAYRALLADLSAEVMRHVSRDLDRTPQMRLRAAE